ncbi:hypothetical protein QK414_29190 [Pseudomonas aeruginosa]|nr:hypothetical protein [Pseudomonas aeruginosa]MDI4056912.1 hypothetical protein [Pseudomonas aeruginosa]MDI4167037.1 hypothetical protein [Pseudomonas aeruginosa]
MKVFKIPSDEFKGVGKVTFKMHCHYEDKVLQELTIECYENGVEIGKMLAKVIKHDGLESSYILKCSCFNNRFYMYSDFMGKISFAFDEGPRLRLNNKFRNFDRNIMIVEEVFLYRGERYSGEKRDIFNLFSDPDKEYVFLHKDF